MSPREIIGQCQCEFLPHVPVSVGLDNADRILKALDEQGMAVVPKGINYGDRSGPMYCVVCKAGLGMCDHIVFKDGHATLAGE
jgi:hypothetical protein